MSQKNVALVVGASGIIGNALVETLAAHPDWSVRALRRTDVAGVATIDANLHDAVATAAALRAAGDTTHVFYAALAPQPDLAQEETVNLAMLQNLLDGLKAAGAPIQRVVLYQGAKVYGVHLGNVHAPFYENDPRYLGPNFYYAQEDLLAERATRDGFDWAILRPDVVVGSAVGNTMNITVTMAVYAALSQARGLPLRFPGSPVTYRDVLAQVTDAGWLARASIWAALATAARNEAFNLVGEPFRWERIWRTSDIGCGVRQAGQLGLRRLHFQLRIRRGVRYGQDSPRRFCRAVRQYAVDRHRAQSTAGQEDHSLSSMHGVTPCCGPAR
jgi:nucleoside-diphosphate-sugar epimerase